MPTASQRFGLPNMAHRLTWQNGPRGLAADLRARHDQVQQSKSELRVLKVQFLESIIVNHRGLNFGLAAYRLCAPAIRREQANFSKQGALSEGLLDFDDFNLAGDDIERRGGIFTALHEDVTCLEIFRTRIRQQPIDIH